MAALGKLVVNLSANTAEFNNAMNRAAFTAQNRMDAISKAAKVAGGALAALGAANFLRSAIVQTAQFADEMGKTAQRAGVATEAFSELAFAAKLADVSNDELARSLRLLGNDAAEGGRKLKALGIDIRDAGGNAKTSDQLFADLADRISAIQDPAQRVAVASELLGDRLGARMVTLLGSGSRSFRELADEARRLGVVITDEAAEAAAQFNDNMVRLETATKGLVYQLGNALIPSLTRMTNEFLIGMKHADGFFDALLKFGTMNPFRTNAENLAVFVAELERLEARREEIVSGGGRRRSRMNQTANIDREIELLRTRIAFLRELEEKASAPLPGAAGDAGGNDGTAQRLRDLEQAARKVESYTDGLRRQIEAAQNLTAEEQVLRDIQLGRITNVTDAQREELLGYARQIDMLRMLDAELDAATKREQELRDEALRRSNALAQAGRRVFEETRTPLENLNIRFGYLNDLLRQGAIDWDVYSRAVMQAQTEFDELNKAAETSTSNMTQLVEGWANRSADAIADFAMTGKLNFRSLVNSMIADLVRLAAKQTIMNAIGGFFPGFKFAEGGVMTGSGPMPLKAYATGGIANSPQLALFGEGSQPEAFVPLPDGRTIPVTLNGAGGGGTSNVVVNVNVENGGMQSVSQGDAGQLGKAIAVAVRSELINQKRPGGLLAA